MATAATKGSGIHVVVFDERDKILPLIRKAIIESITSFNYLPACMSYIDEMTMDNETTIVVTTSIDDRVIKTFEASNSIEAVFILSTTRKEIDKSFTKVVGVYPRMDNLLPVLFETLDIVELQLNANSILFHRNLDGSDNIDFYFYNLWFSHEINQKLTKKDLVEQANIFYRSKKQMQTAIHEFDTSYNKLDILNWIHRSDRAFPYHILITNALRTHDQHILGLTRFFILDVTRQLKPLSTIQMCSQGYYGTKLPLSIVDRFEQQTSRDIISFQCFLPVTKTRANALAVAVRPTRRRKMISVLFKIDAINALGVHMGDIILLDMATAFYIIGVSRYAGFGSARELVTIIQLVAVDSGSKQQLYEEFIEKKQSEGRSIDEFLIDTIPLLKSDDMYKRQNKNKLDTPKDVPELKDIPESKDICEDEIAGDEFIAHGEWDQAINAFSRIEDPNVRVLNKAGCLLREHLQNLPGALECHEQALRKATNREKADTLMHLGTVNNDMRQHNEALKCYSQALQWYENEKPKDPATIARCLVGLGNAHWACRQLNEALDCAQRALNIREQEVKPRNDFEIAGCLGNMGNILHDQGDMEHALSCAQRAADILSQCGKNDPRVAAAYNNLGAMYLVCGDYSKAREYFQRALDSLPIENHPYRISTLNNIARLNAIEKGQKP
ncbi:unnamed protein product [Adineta steineri]|uniref:Uncharacterized protein n=1 Tax=Adineta steineri TaxID=433720 RepID=A0A814RZR8_9BILA|nr:unnamed protein product [Adineta steineri]CAF3574723.1 unnamed protein product [Adineta steineri]